MAPTLQDASASICLDTMEISNVLYSLQLKWAVALAEMQSIRKKQGGGGLGHKLKLFPVKSVWAKVHEAKDSLMQVELC